ncbi:hypothetical protein [Kosakonia virus Kc318]|uniref:Uncharacterized protein n=1 Tax=Kosakonia virus Kc318 TaxID=2797327 RepID=A0AAE7P5I5_9CAUD|nr:hypothetical protein [Kosakonia virus Kc318]
MTKATETKATNTTVNDVVPAYKEYANLAALKKDMDKVLKDSRTLQAAIQVVAWGCLRHAVEHKDWTVANTLINKFVKELGDGVRKVALVEWFKLAGLTVNEQGDGFSGWKGAEYITENADELKKKMWWKQKPVNPFKGFDLNDEIKRLIEKAEKQAAAKMEAEQGTAKKDAKVATKEDAAKINIDTALLTKLRALVGA